MEDICLQFMEDNNYNLSIPIYALVVSAAYQLNFHRKSILGHYYYRSMPGSKEEEILTK